MLYLLVGCRLCNWCLELDISSCAAIYSLLSELWIEQSLLAQKLELVEDNAPRVEDLRDVTSAEDAEVESYAAVIDPSSSCLASSQDAP